MENISGKRPVSAPAIPLPAGAWDSHAHIFGPFDRYPLLEPRRYEPPLAPMADYIEMLDKVGFERGVLVHSSASGFDNSLTRDGIVFSAGRVPGIAVVPLTVSDAELEALRNQGFQGLRFTINGPRSQLFPGSLDFNDLRAFAPRLKALGMHAQIWAKAEYLVVAAAELATYGIPLVLDHMGYFEVDKGIDDPLFASLLAMVKDGDFWVKMTPVRLTKADPTYEIVRPFHDRLMQAIPDRVLFGSDWPYISMDAAPPDVGKMVDMFDRWTPDPGLRQKIFVDNPRALYG
ncbi:amidohydrolase family protein [Herbaspirillum lusitanum]|uniref:Amidohydrolase family protein n=1 Tax=Herbaspirillum lusitanum TaxID=213312 RepID=A0ABW9ABW5_9BURK